MHLGRVLAASGWILIAASWLPLLKVHNRWIRMLDFPRIQLAIGCLATLGMAAIRPAGAGSRVRSRPFWSFFLAASCLRHAWRLFPFTPLKRPESASADKAKAGDAFAILIANVRMSNREPRRLLARVRRESPDLVLLIETDDWWMEQVLVLDPLYPWQVKVPQPNTYGMILLSRLPLRETGVDRKVHREVPSIQAVVEPSPGKSFRIYCVHPRPPAEEDTDDRDAELYLVGRDMDRSGIPVIVAGDLNDVAWSRTTRLFQEVSGTQDPRVGRGFFNTYHAGIPFLRYSLDHIFHSPHFQLVGMRRLRSIGSDHFPILIRLRIASGGPHGVPPPAPEKEERRRIRDTLREAPGSG